MKFPESTVIDLFSALETKETNLKVKHQRKAAYKQLFSDALPLNSYGKALQVKNDRFCQLFKLANKGMNQ